MCATCIRSWRAFQSGFGFGLENRFEAFFAFGYGFAQSDDFLER